MTFAMTSDVDDAHPSGTDLELTSANDAARYIGDNCLNDGPVGLVGLEIEAHCFDLSDPMRRPGWGEINEIISDISPLPGGSAITVEPGGAVELSGPPLDGALLAIVAMQGDRAALRAAFAR